MYSSFDGELDSGAHQELEEVVTAGRQGEEGSAGRQRREICQGGQRLRVTLGDGKEPGRRGAASAPNGRRERALADVAGTKGTWHSLFGVHLAWALRGRNLEWEGTGHHYRFRPRSRSHKTASKCNRPIFSGSHQLYQRPPAQSVRVSRRPSKRPQNAHSSSTSTKSASSGTKSGAASTVLAGFFHSHHLQNT